MQAIDINSSANGSTDPTSLGTAALSTLFDSFKKSVVDKFRITVDGKEYGYSEYLMIPPNADVRSGDEANAVDQQFMRYTLEWLGFKPVNWRYNVPQPGTGKKLNRPDYVILGSIGIAFIVEDKNSTIDFDIEEHIKQMRRYSVGTAGYSVWCNMRRLLAVRFLPSNTLKHEVLVDIAVEDMFGSQQILPMAMKVQIANLALFQLLFSKDRFTNFSRLAKNISVDEQTFEF